MTIPINLANISIHVAVIMDIIWADAARLQLKLLN